MLILLKLQERTFLGVVGYKLCVHLFCLLRHCIHTHKGEANTSNLIKLYLKTVLAVIVTLICYHEGLISSSPPSSGISANLSQFVHVYLQDTVLYLV